jgi:hypothetical protein
MLYPIYIKLFKWKNPLRKTSDHQASHPWQHLALLDHVEGLAPVMEPQEKMSENSVPLNPMVNDHYPY